MARSHSLVLRSTPHQSGVATAVQPHDRPVALPLHRELVRQLDAIPKDMGVALLVLGAFGAMIPGPVPVGFSFILLGGVLLRPAILAYVGPPIERRCPGVLRVLIDMVAHYRSDLARRYPATTTVSDGVPALLPPQSRVPRGRAALRTRRPTRPSSSSRLIRDSIARPASRRPR